MENCSIRTLLISYSYKIKLGLQLVIFAEVLKKIGLVSQMKEGMLETYRRNTRHYTRRGKLA